jgi:two-component system, LytTR family, response regulator
VRPLRVLIVDDEPLARSLIRMLAEGDDEVLVVGECSGVDGVAEVARTRPDILFLDVQMPEVDGFEVLQGLGPGRRPAVVFVTAYDQYAVRAFDVHAVDYLLKPVDDARFARALARAKAGARAPSAGSDPRLDALLRERPRHARRFLVRAREKTLVVDADAIDWIEAADYYVSLHVGGTTHLLRETMADLLQQLDPERFFRVHRSAIVNLERVQEIHPLFRGDCELVLRTGATVRLSRSRRAEFRRLLAAPPAGRR